MSWNCGIGESRRLLSKASMRCSFHCFFSRATKAPHRDRQVRTREGRSVSDIGREQGRSERREKSPGGIGGIKRLRGRGRGGRHVGAAITQMR